MFGLSLKEKTESVISKEFHYVVSDMQRQTFNVLVSQGKSLGENEYSIAIMYMLTVMNMIAAPFEAEGQMIDPKEGRNHEEKEQFESFIELHIRTISKIKHLANSPESDIQELVDQVLENADLKDASPALSEKVLNPQEEQIIEEEISAPEELISEEELPTSDEETLEDEDLNDKDVEVLMEGAGLFLLSMNMANNFIESSLGSKHLSPYQLKILYGLQLLGAIDCLSQKSNASLSAAMAVLQVKLASEEIFSFEQAEAISSFEKILDMQEEDWAQKVILSGGNAVIKMATKDDGGFLPTMDIFDDEELMKEAAQRIS